MYRKVGGCRMRSRSDTIVAMHALLRRLAAAATIGMIALVALPGSVAADCNGPACMEVPPVEGPTILVTVVIAVAFFMVMAVAEARRR